MPKNTNFYVAQNKDILTPMCYVSAMQENHQEKTLRVSKLAVKLLKKCKTAPYEPNWQTIEKVCTEYLVNHGGQS